MPSGRVIRVQPAAPVKPPQGAPCNGCGVCCLAEPCPLGMLVSRRFKGACRALLWDVPRGRYVCGMVHDPSAVLGKPWSWVHPFIQRLSRRWIAAGSGCDSDLLATPADADRL